MHLAGESQTLLIYTVICQYASYTHTQAITNGIKGLMELTESPVNAVAPE